MRKQDMLYRQEYVWLISILDKEIAYVNENLAASKGHPLWKLRLDNLNTLRDKLVNQMNWRPKKKKEKRRR